MKIDEEEEEAAGKDYEDWYKLSSFDTKIELQNTISVSKSKDHDREAIIITIDNPRFYLQPGAFDIAILFWLNYKSTYESWLSKRKKFADLHELPSGIQNQNNKANKQQQQQLANNNDNNFLALKLHVSGLGLALPLSNKPFKDFKTNSDSLLITLNDTSIYACSSGCVVSTGRFSNFCLRFVDNFNLASLDWMPIATLDDENKKNKSFHINFLPNSWLVPSGVYEVCSSTIQNIVEPINQNKTKLSRPLWILCVKWNMEGIDVNLDTTIGKWLSKFSSTITRLAETQYTNDETNCNSDRQSKEAILRKLKNELIYYKNIDSVKANNIQLEIDRLSVSRYPEKAKKILAKHLKSSKTISSKQINETHYFEEEETRNNIKGHIGFDTKTAATNSNNQSSTENIKKHKINQNIKISREENDLVNNKQKYSNIHHSRSKSGDVNIRKNHERTKSEPFARIFSLIKSFSNENSGLNIINESKSTLLNTSTKKNKKSSPQGLDKSLLSENSGTEVSPIIHRKREDKSSKIQNNPTTPAIDFKLDVKIEINSGKCILQSIKPPQPPPIPNFLQSKKHQQQTKPSPQQQQQQQQQTNQNGISNPNFKFAHNEARKQAGSTSTVNLSEEELYKDQIKKHEEVYRNYLKENKLTLTNIVFPAIKMKAYYVSTHVEINKRLFKKANLYSNIKIDSFVLPYTYGVDDHVLVKNEMRFGPQLLDFLELTLEPFDISNKTQEDKSQSANNSNQVHFEENEDDNGVDNDNQLGDDEKTMNQNNSFSTSNTSILMNNSQTQAYFPVDVIVIVSMLPSSLHFTCQPTSSMNCLLKLPSIDLVFSTKSLSSNQKEEKSENTILGKPNQDFVINNDGGGLSVTCCITNFALKFYNQCSAASNLSQIDYFHERVKDSLSVEVEFIKVNISRSRRHLNQNSSNQFNDVKLSVLADIGRAAFSCDMRNIKEILEFPRIWYRRSLARRLFLGEEPIVTNKSPSHPLLIKSHHNRSFDNPSTKQRQSSNHHSASNWQTLVLVSINLSQLEVKMSVGNVLGQVCWTTTNTQSKSKISISSFGPRKIQFNFVFDSSTLLALGGSLKWTIRVQDISSFVELNDEAALSNSRNTLNQFNLVINAMELKTEMIGYPTPILTCRLSSFITRLSDEWEEAKRSSENQDKINQIVLGLHMTWDQLHLMITRSTTPELILFYYRLTSFISSQSKVFKKEKQFFNQTDENDENEKKMIIDQKDKVLRNHFNISGGNIYIKGNNFTIITFHSTNFRAQKWALFSLNEPSLEFSTDGYTNKQESSQNQGLCFYLGRNEICDKNNQNMASIYMVQRDSNNVTQYSTINEWFEYAHHGIDAVGLRNFPVFREDTELKNDMRKKIKVNEKIKYEEIFHLPRLEIFYNSLIVKDKVTFSFKTEFHDHILTTFSTQHLHFLYELIKAYIKEKEIIKQREETIPRPVIDQRVYECLQWKLEPTLKFISRLGNVDSFGVDTLLTHLGLNQAKTTIPKWTQRGLVDNADQLIEEIKKLYMKILPDDS